MVISVQETINKGSSRTLSFQLAKADKAVKLIKEVHIMTTLTLNYIFAGQKEVIVKNIPVDWVQTKKPAAAKP